MNETEQILQSGMGIVAPATSASLMTKGGAILRQALYVVGQAAIVIAVLPLPVVVKEWAAGAGLLAISIRQYIDGSWHDAQANEARDAQVKALAQQYPLPANVQKAVGTVDNALPDALKFVKTVEAVIPAQAATLGKVEDALTGAEQVLDAMTHPADAVTLPAQTSTVPDENADPAQSEAVKLAANFTNHELFTTTAPDGTKVLTDTAPTGEVNE